MTWYEAEECMTRYGHFGVSRGGWMKHALTGDSYICVNCDEPTPYKFKVRDYSGSYLPVVAWDLCEQCAIKVAKAADRYDQSREKAYARKCARDVLDRAEGA